MSLDTGIKLMTVVVLGIFALGAFLEGVETDFKPPRRTQAILFITGFLEMLAITWLIFPDPWYEMLWLKLLCSILFGLFWAFTAPKRWQFIQQNMKKQE